MEIILVLGLLAIVLWLQIRGRLIEQLKEEVEHLKTRNAELMKENHRLSGKMQDKKELEDLMDEAKLGERNE